jgi:hypothetical protein
MIRGVLAVPCIFDRISSQNTAGCSARRRIGVLEAVVMREFAISVGIRNPALSDSDK